MKNLYQILSEKGIYYQGGISGDGEVGGSGDKKE